MLKVWGRTNSVNVQKVMWAVAELGVAHERIDAGMQFGGLDTEDYGSKNPNRMIPLVEDGDLAVWDSHAIVRYLAARHGAGSLWPLDPGERAAADMWMEWYYRIHPPLGVCFMQIVRTPEAQRDMPAVEAAARQLASLWPILDAHLAQRPFVGGEALTMGDIPVGCAWHRYANLAIERPSLPHLDAWSTRLRSRPPYRTHVMIPLT